MAVKTYNADEVVVSFGGLILSGWGDGEFLAVEYDEDAWTTTVGSDGEVARARSNNDVATATVTLLQTSDSNADLNALALRDKRDGSAALPFIAKDLKGNVVVSSEDAWIQKQPSMNYDREVTGRDWVFKLAKAEFKM